MSAKKPGPQVSPFTFPQRYDLPQPPAGGPPASADAHRQTGVLLADELALFQRGMNLELRLVAHSRGSRYRTPALAALLGFWSRSFSYRGDACSMATRGSYVSCLPVLRAAADCIAAQKGVAGDDRQEFLEWLAAGVRQSKEHAALEIELGRYRSAATLATDQRLGAMYRVLTELSMPHFGATVLQVAPECDQEKLSIAFGESGFHLGWAQLIFGWLLALTTAQLETAASADGPFAVSGEVTAERGRLSAEIEGVLARGDRCRVEEVDDGRFLLHNFRRRTNGERRRILL